MADNKRSRGSTEAGKNNSVVVSTTYFAEAGEQNTEETLRLAKKRADDLGIRSVVVATTGGDTGLRAAEVFSGLDLVVVTHVTGFTGPNVQELAADKRALMESRGARVVTAAHAFGGVGRAVRRKMETYQVDEIIANTLRRFGQGMKVACEIAMMAADAGLVRTDEDVICVAGTGSGADTAVVLKPANSHDFFELKVRETICKPRL